MKIAVENVDGATMVVLSEVYSGVGIDTEMGFFGIAQRDGGIEVMLDGKTVWASFVLDRGGCNGPPTEPERRPGSA